MLESRRSIVKKLSVTAGYSLFSVKLARAQKIEAGDSSVKNRAYNKLTKRVPKYRALIENDQMLAKAFLKVRSRNQPFRIQSSGHCFAGHSQTNDTLFDLRKLNSVNVDAGGRTVTVGAAATVDDINKATDPFGLAMPAGYCPSVAMGGHVTAGGVGVLSRRYGLACDQLLAAKVLTANGSFVSASADENADLFWALCGGGAASFGIVSEMTLKLHQPGPMSIVNFQLSMPIARAARWIMKWQEMAAAASSKLNFHLQAIHHVDDKILLEPRLVSSATGEETVKVALAISQIDELLNKPRIAQGSYKSVCEMMWPRGDFPELNSMFASTYLAEPVSATEWEKVLATLNTPRNIGLGFLIEGVGGAIDDIGPTASAYPHRKGSQFLVQVFAQRLQNPSTQDETGWFQACVNALEAVSTGGAYFNYPQTDLDNWARAYWGNNLERLVEVKRKWDPDNVFSHPQSVPLKVPL